MLENGEQRELPGQSQRRTKAIGLEIDGPVSPAGRGEWMEASAALNSLIDLPIYRKMAHAEI